MSDLITAKDIFATAPLGSVIFFTDIRQTWEFTTMAAAYRAIAHALHFHPPTGKSHIPHLTVSDARDLMDAPETPAANSFCCFMEPKLTRDSNGNEHYPVNAADFEPEYVAWATIQNIESKAFVYARDGYIQWSENGRKRYNLQSGEFVIEANGQSSFL